jgi:hypothetical protein
MRRIAEGWIVTKVGIPCGDTSARPRLSRMVTRRSRTALAAVTPRHTRTAGRTSQSSCSNHGWQASTSDWLGRSWMRRLPPASTFHLKCLTAFVT